VHTQTAVFEASHRIARLLEAGTYARADTVTVDRDGGHAATRVLTVEYLAMRGLADLPVLMLEASNHPYKASRQELKWHSTPHCIAIAA